VGAKGNLFAPRNPPAEYPVQRHTARHDHRRAAAAGAILGDCWLYWIAHRYRERILQVWPLSRVPNLVSGGAALLKSHPIKSLVVSRFTPARAVVPIVAGIADMPAMQFYAGDILSALAWAPAHVVPGALLGTASSIQSCLALLA